VLVWDDDKLQILVTRGHLNGFALHLVRLFAAPPCFDKLVVADNFGDTSVDGVGCLEEPARGGVGKPDQPVIIGDEHAVGHLLEDSGETRALGIQC